MFANRPARARPATDPYINVDAGTMSPFEHGEVFVLDDGGEARAQRGARALGAASTLRAASAPAWAAVQRSCTGAASELAPVAHAPAGRAAVRAWR